MSLLKGFAMSTSCIDLLIEDLNKKLGDRPFYTLRELTLIGFFGSLPAARLALKKGDLVFIKISPRRFIIPRSVVLEYVRKNLSKGHQPTSSGKK